MLKLLYGRRQRSISGSTLPAACGIRTQVCFRDSASCSASDCQVPICSQDPDPRSLHSHSPQSCKRQGRALNSNTAVGQQLLLNDSLDSRIDACSLQKTPQNTNQLRNKASWSPVEFNVGKFLMAKALSWGQILSTLWFDKQWPWPLEVGLVT